MRKKVAAMMATALGGVAVIFVSTACWVLGHQADVPQELLEK